MKRSRAQPIRIAISLSRVVLLAVALGIVLIRVFPYTNSFTALPKVTKNHSGIAGDPINLIFVGSQEQLTTSFEQAGWLLPDPITAHSTEQIILATVAHRRYPTAPVSNLYLFGRAQDLAFEKPTSDVAVRDHIRLWQTDMQVDGESVWECQASYDHGIELSGSTHLPTHHIAPAVDLERDSVGSALQHTGNVHDATYVAFTTPIFAAHNAGGDFYASDGEVLVINLTTASLHGILSAAGAPDLRRATFSIYAMLLMTPMLALIVDIVALALAVGALWPELQWLLRMLNNRRRATPRNARAAQ